MLLNMAGYLNRYGVTHPHQSTSACKDTSPPSTGTYPPPAKLLNFPAELGAGPSGPSCPFLPFPPSLGTWTGPWTWHLDLQLEQGGTHSVLIWAIHTLG